MNQKLIKVTHKKTIVVNGITRRVTWIEYLER
jgi:hypothetical protein